MSLILMCNYFYCILLNNISFIGGGRGCSCSSRCPSHLALDLEDKGSISICWMSEWKNWFACEHSSWNYLSSPEMATVSYRQWVLLRVNLFLWLHFMWDWFGEGIEKATVQVLVGLRSHLWRNGWIGLNGKTKFAALEFISMRKIKKLLKNLT